MIVSTCLSNFTFFPDVFVMCNDNTTFWWIFLGCGVRNIDDLADVDPNGFLAERGVFETKTLAGFDKIALVDETDFETGILCGIGSGVDWELEIKIKIDSNKIVVLKIVYAYLSIGSSSFCGISKDTFLGLSLSDVWKRSIFTFD